MIVQEMKLRVFEAGDSVRTPDGVGKVIRNDFTLHDDGSLWYYEVEVQHKSGSSRNTSNAPKMLDALECVSIITDEEYDNEREW